MAEFDVMFNRLVVAMVVAAGLMGSSLLAAFASGPEVGGIQAVAVVGFGLSIMLGIWLLWGVIRSGRV